MIEPMEWLERLRASALRNELDLQPSEHEPDLFICHADDVDAPQFTYLRLVEREPTAMAMITTLQPYEGLASLEIAAAVPIHLRDQGRASDVVQAALRDLRHALASRGHHDFYVQATVLEDDEAGARIAARTISHGFCVGLHPRSGIEARLYLALASALPPQGMV